MFAGLQRRGFVRSTSPDGEASLAAATDKNAETAASATQRLRLQQTALDNAANAIVITDPQGTILWVNPGFTALTGYTTAEVAGRTPRMLNSGRHDAAFYRGLWQTILAGAVWRGEFTNRRKDGSLYQGEQVITPVRGDDGAITHFVAVMNDVTARRQAEAAQQATHRQLQHLLDHSPAVIYGLKWENERIVPHFVTENISRLLGFSPAETMSHEWWLGRLHPDDRARAVAGIAETREHESSVTEYRLCHRDGTWRWVEDRRRVIRDAGGRPIEFIGVWNDITERKRADDVLRGAVARQSTQQSRRIARELGIVAAGAALVFASGSVFGWFETIFAQLTRENLHPYADETTGALGFLLIGLFVFSLRRWRESRADVISQQHVTGALRALHDELDRRVQQRTSELARLNGELHTEVAERRNAEEALRQSEERYRALVDAAPTGIFVHVDGRVAYANAAMGRILGAASPEQLAGTDTFAFVHPDCHAAIRERIASGLAGRSVPLMDQRYLRLDGTVVEVETMATPIAFAGRPGIQVIVNDVTRRKQAEARLGLEHAVTQVLAEGGSLEQTCRRVLETIGGSLHWEVGELWKVDRARGVLCCAEIWHPPSREFEAFASTTRQWTFAPGAGLPGRVWAQGRAEWIADLALAPDYTRRALADALGLHNWIGFPVKLRDEIVGVVGFFATQAGEPGPEKLATLAALGSQLGQFIERQQLAEQFRHAQKMEAIGTLAGGIAHDFNNIIAAITGYAQLAKMESGANPEVASHLDAVLAGSTRAASLVRQILAFSRQQEHERQPIQLRHIVAEALHLLRATIPATIEFEHSFARDLPPVLADATQVHQVVMNLGTNAAHAMHDRPGRLGIRLEGCFVDADMAEAHPGLRPGACVLLSVSDTGDGMDEATVGRIFEPFFTTKAPGEGTGLGLAVVHGVMQSHEGSVTVCSRPGEGTVFRLYFPACPAEAAETELDETDVPAGHGERVLYVDDEAPIARVTGRVLEHLGYAVETHTKPVEALAAVRREPGRYDLVITDLAMPVMSGTDLAREILALRPDLPVLLATGYTATLTPARVQAMGIRELLSKPISVHALGTVVARVLAGAKPD